MRVIDTFNGALLLRQQVLQELRDQPDVLWRGVMIILFVGLLVGGVQGVSTGLAILDPGRALGQVRTDFERQIEDLLVALPQPEAQESMRQSASLILATFDSVERVVSLPTDLPRPVAALLSGLSIWLGTPLAYLGNALFVIVLAHAAARQFGGQGSLEQMIGVGALSVAPHALDALQVIPFLGNAVGPLAWVWGLVILISGVAVVHRFDGGKAVMVVALYPGLLLLLGLIAFCSFFFMGLASLGAV